MKLISMTDFVLEVSKQTTNEGNSLVRNFNKIKNYAQFLKQPLKLEMFVPCDDSEQAKEKVFFEDCSVIQQGENTIVMYKESGLWLTWTNRIIEDLIKEDITLTPKAIKQFN